MRTLIALMVVAGLGSPWIAGAQEATPTPQAGCAGKNAGDVCTASDGTQSKCIQLELKLPDSRGAKAGRPSISPLVCPRKAATAVAADVAKHAPPGSKRLLIAAACAVGAIVVLLAGAKWMSAPAPASTEPTKKE